MHLGEYSIEEQHNINELDRNTNRIHGNVTISNQIDKVSNCCITLLLTHICSKK